VCRLKKVRRAKRGVRGELSVSGGDWTRRGYAGVPGLLRSVHAASAARCVRWLTQCCRRRAKTLHPLQRGCGGGHAAARRRPPRVGGGASRRRRCTPPSAPHTAAAAARAQTFVKQFEERRLPCIIEHAMDGWPAAEAGGPRQWSWEKLRERFKDHKFKARAIPACSQQRLAPVDVSTRRWAATTTGTPCV
jgi:hypothetical protein